MRVRGWMTVLKNTFVDIQENHTLEFAAALSYYFVLSLFPALIAFSAVLAFLPIDGLFARILQITPRFVPPDSMGVVRGMVKDVMQSNHPALLSFGLLGTLWTASTGFASMIEALNMAYEVRETRPLWKTRALALAMTFVVGFLVLAALAIMVVGPEAREWLQRWHVPELAHVWPVVRWTAATLLVIAAVEFTYFSGPNLRQRFRHTLLGAVLAVAAWMGLSYALGLYFQRFAHLNATYGALGGAITLLIWLYWSFFVVLLGAELNGEWMKASGEPRLAKERPPEETKRVPARRHRAA